MRIFRVMMLCALALASATPPVAAQANMNAQEQANVKFVLDWWREVLQSRHVELAPKYQAEDYIQHNINIPTGRAAFQKFFGSRGEPTTIAAELNPPAIAFGKGDYVVARSANGRARIRPTRRRPISTTPSICCACENGKVQEHWDRAQKQPKIPYGGAPDGIDYSKVTFKLSPQERRTSRSRPWSSRTSCNTATSSWPTRSWPRPTSSTTRTCPPGRAAFVEFFSQIRKPEPIKPEWKDKPTITLVSGSYVFMISTATEKDPNDPNKTIPRSGST